MVLAGHSTRIFQKEVNFATLVDQKIVFCSCVLVVDTGLVSILAACRKVNDFSECTFVAGLEFAWDSPAAKLGRH